MLQQQFVDSPQGDRFYCGCGRCSDTFRVKIHPNRSYYSNTFIWPLCESCHSELYPHKLPFTCIECGGPCYLNEPTCREHYNHIYCLNCTHDNHFDCVMKLHYLTMLQKEYYNDHIIDLRNLKSIPNGIIFPRSKFYALGSGVYIERYAILECINNQILYIFENSNGKARTFSQYKIYTPDINFNQNGLLHMEVLKNVTPRQLFELSGQLPSANRTTTYFGAIPRDIVGLLDQWLVGRE